MKFMYLFIVFSNKPPVPVLVLVPNVDVWPKGVDVVVAPIPENREDCWGWAAPKSPTWFWGPFRLS